MASAMMDFMKTPLSVYSAFKARIKFVVALMICQKERNRKLIFTNFVTSLAHNPGLTSRIF